MRLYHDATDVEIVREARAYLRRRPETLGKPGYVVVPLYPDDIHAEPDPLSAIREVKVYTKDWRVER